MTNHSNHVISRRPGLRSDFKSSWRSSGRTADRQGRLDNASVTRHGSSWALVRAPAAAPGLRGSSASRGADRPRLQRGHGHISRRSRPAMGLPVEQRLNRSHPDILVRVGVYRQRNDGRNAYRREHYVRLPAGVRSALPLPRRWPGLRRLLVRASGMPSE